MCQEKFCRLLFRGQLGSCCLLTHKACDATYYRWHTLPVVPSNEEHITENTLDESEQQPERSFNLNFIISGLKFLFWKSTLLCVGLPFNKRLLGIFSSPWQHTQQVNNTTVLTCSDTTLQAKGHLHKGAHSCPIKWLVNSWVSSYPQVSAIWITFHANTQGHFVEVPLGCQTVFLHHREVLGTLE